MFFPPLNILFLVFGFWLRFHCFGYPDAWSPLHVFGPPSPSVTLACGCRAHGGQITLQYFMLLLDLLWWPCGLVALVAYPW